MSENPRIAELRRRVDKDPTSIAFAQLAEEYRRTGDYQAAVKVCREGLARHPGYLSAQVTLGRALMELEEYDEACSELEAVLRAAPDNLTAIRALADIHQRRGDAPEMVDLHVAPLEAAPPVDLSLDATMPTFDETTDSGANVRATISEAATSGETLPSLDALESLSLDLPPMPDLGDWTLDTSLSLDLPTPTFAEPPLDQLEVPAHAATTRSTDPVLEELEHWLAAIVADRSESQ